MAGTEVTVNGLVDRAAERPNLVPLEIIREITGYETESPNRAAERDMRAILADAEDDFEAVIVTIVGGSRTPA